MTVSALDAILGILVQPLDIERKEWENIYIVNFSESFAPMLHANEICGIHNSKGEFRIIGKEKYW